MINRPLLIKISTKTGRYELMADIFAQIPVPLNCNQFFEGHIHRHKVCRIILHISYFTISTTMPRMKPVVLEIKNNFNIGLLSTNDLNVNNIWEVHRTKTPSRATTKETLHTVFLLP